VFFAAVYFHAVITSQQEKQCHMSSPQIATEIVVIIIENIL